MQLLKKTLTRGLAPCLLMLLLMAAPALRAQSPIGTWKTIDDETNKPKSLVQIYEQDGKLYGKVVELFRGPDEEQNPICDDCDEDDPRYNQPVRGMVILEGLEPAGNNTWEGGEILDPANGSVYSCYIELQSADKLKVRGFIGFSLLGRTQYWYREK
ncbi:MAG: DUF2147 domain-containing protein [Bacteroidetes bacterium]|nr:MAG: DUF2147 domain-containing protein [Bacteroidota bacterium]